MDAHPLYISPKDLEQAECLRFVGKNVRVTESGQMGTIDEICYDYDIETMKAVYVARVRFPDNHMALFRIEQLEISENVKDEPDDPVNHPSHYTDGKYEVIDFIESQIDQPQYFDIGNAVKYIARAGKKNPEKKKEDLEKAAWYIERYLKWIQDPIPQAITIEQFLEDKGLANTQLGFALELLLEGKPNMAVKALKLAISEEAENS